MGPEQKRLTDRLFGDTISRRTAIRNLVIKHRELAHTTFTTDLDRLNAEHRWLLDAVITLLVEERGE